jgi:hypothetical protein
MPLILAVRELCGEVTAQDMQMIAEINKIILNLKFMSEILKKDMNKRQLMTLL